MFISLPSTEVPTMKKQKSLLLRISLSIGGDRDKCINREDIGKTWNTDGVSGIEEMVLKGFF